MIKLFTWTPENSVGVTEIDVQHQHIFSIINNLADSISKNNAQGEIDKILGELVEYSKVHFGTEEKYFKMFDYIYTKDHTDKHHYYNQKVSEFYEKVKDPTQKNTLPLEIIDFLKDWWINHINIEDKKYTNTFHHHGLF